jgi:hypothetical protein
LPSHCRNIFVWLIWVGIAINHDDTEEQGCQIFLGPRIPKREKYQMTTHYNKRP